MAPLKVAVVGAGPSGLIMATALRRRNIRADIFERAESPKQLAVGAGVNLMQPCISVLEQEGMLEAVHACNEPTSHFHFYDAATNSTIRSVDLHTRYGKPYFTVRRGDITRELLEAMPGEGPHYGLSVVAVEEDAGKMRLRFKTGATSEAFDAVVGAGNR